MDSSDYLVTKNRVFLIRQKLKDIEELKVKIHDVYDDFVVEFFRLKGVEVTMVNNPYSPLHYYNIVDVLPDYIQQPTFYISPQELIVNFRWQKKDNKHPTICAWNPIKESLDDFYEKKLKKIYKPYIND